MARWARHGVGMGVIAAGFCAAFQFRVDPPGDTGPTGTRQTQTASALSTDITLQLAPSPVEPAASRELSEPYATAGDRDQHAGSRSSLSSQLPPPRLAPGYQSIEQNVSAPSATFPDMPVQRERPPRLTHTIRDGDSLESIANRYLGDPDRWQEVLDANTDLLNSRDLLPVHTVIDIPLRRIEERQSSPDGAEPSTTDGLVPVRNR